MLSRQGKWAEECGDVVLRSDQKPHANGVSGLVVHVAKYLDGLDRVCEHDCRFCIERLEPGHSGKEIPTLEQIKEALISVTRNNESIETVFIAGGEPTGRKDLLEIVAFIKSLGKRVALTTHGDYPHAEPIAKSLVLAGLDSVAISLHGESAETHDWHTQRPGSYERTLNSLVAFGNVRILPRVNCVVTSQNIQTLRSMVCFLRDHFHGAVQDVCFSHYTNHGNAYYHPELAFDVKEHTQRITEAIDAAGMSLLIRFRDFPYCVDPRLANLDLSVKDLGVLKWTTEGSTIIVPEKAPAVWRVECDSCRLRRACPGFLQSNYGQT